MATSYTKVEADGEDKGEGSESALRRRRLEGQSARQDSQCCEAGAHPGSRSLSASGGMAVDKGKQPVQGHGQVRGVQHRPKKRGDRVVARGEADATLRCSRSSIGKGRSGSTKIYYDFNEAYHGV